MYRVDVAALARPELTDELYHYFIDKEQRNWIESRS